MSHDSHPNPVIAAIFSFAFWFASVNMSVLHDVLLWFKDVDGLVIVPVLHVLQNIAAFLSILCALTVLYPPFKDFFINIFKQKP